MTASNLKAYRTHVRKLRKIALGRKCDRRLDAIRTLSALVLLSDGGTRF